MLATADIEPERPRKSFSGDDALGNLDLRKIRSERWEKAARPCSHYIRDRLCGSTKVSTSDAMLKGTPVPPPIPAPAKSNLTTPMPAHDGAREM
ncbi:hypothetical protein [Rhizobium sp. WYCCWR 11128]|uniref:hypothetical protein n=1 Tax=Rhizobium sp. WYCCWR 11128 TaxID=2749832 RepID=UPI0015D373CC|nr:hypothetical protein [Rhizobium sp. WYCCWR 11128]NYT32530.1 hypothetical protein [Rhizobium sp. WYCCWR 11128]